MREFTWPDSNKTELLRVASSDPWHLVIKSTVYDGVQLTITTTDRLGGIYTAEELASFNASIGEPRIRKSLSGLVPAYTQDYESPVGLRREIWIVTDDFSYNLTIDVIGGLKLRDLSLPSRELTQRESDIAWFFVYVESNFVLYHKAAYAS